VQDLAELLRGIAALLWPITVIAALIIFRSQLGSLINRIRRAKAPGLEVELDRLSEEVTELEPLPAPALAEGPEDVSEIDKAATETEEAVKTILEAAATSPQAGLMLLSAELETAMRRVLAAVGHYPDRPLSLRQMAQELRRVAGLPNDLMLALSDFSIVRNRIVHGEPDVSERDTLRAVDIGLSLLRAIRVLPYERHVVVESGLDVFSDSKATSPLKGVTAVVLAAQDDQGVTIREQAFPTTRTYFRPGMHVSWEWDPSHTWDECWYRHPSLGIHYGWTSSMEFVGRDIDRL
jgi:hypothetical protein